MATITLNYLLPGIYTRHDYKEVPSKLKVKELFSQLSNLVNKPFDKLEWKVDHKMYTLDKLRPHSPHLFHQCICSCAKLHNNYTIVHNSGLSCTIGSECIHHFGSDNMSKIVDALKRKADRCVGGKLIFDKRTTMGKKKCCGDLNCGCVICVDCKQHKLECTCNYCIAGNLIITGIECGRKQCPCYICKKCKKDRIKCICHKCLDCGDILEEKWKQRCLKCFKNQKIKCKNCDNNTVSSRPLCRDCYFNKSVYCSLCNSSGNFMGEACWECKEHYS